MTWIAPIPFRAAVEYLAGRKLLPTGLNSEDLRQLDRDLRARSFFSARTTNATYLQEIKSAVQRLLGGEINQATARAELKTILAGLGYTPEGGFPGDEPVPPASAGELRDLSSTKRLDLVLETNLRQVANFGFQKQGQTDGARFSYPAWELVRIHQREKPRDEFTDLTWASRFYQAGGKLRDGRMVAAKDDPVWDNLGGSELFPDGLDASFPPFAFHSGMGWRAVRRDEAIALGVIGENEMPEVRDAALNDELKVTAEQFDPALLAQLRQELGAKIEAGELRFKSELETMAAGRRARTAAAAAARTARLAAR